MTISLLPSRPPVAVTEMATNYLVGFTIFAYTLFKPLN
jgi:hypothetical protein